MNVTNADADREPKPDSTQLALERTWMAHDRTLMAWVRTATSMIGFGFTIYKFFELEPVHLHVGSRFGEITPRDFALMMISIGLITLVLATVGRRKDIAGISKQLRRSRSSMAEIVAGLVLVFGILVLLATALRG